MTSGIQRLFGDSATADVIDVLLDFPPEERFSKTDLIELADVPKTSFISTFAVLRQTGVIAVDEKDYHVEYYVDRGSPVWMSLVELDGVARRAYS